MGAPRIKTTGAGGAGPNAGVRALEGARGHRLDAPQPCSLQPPGGRPPTARGLSSHGLADESATLDHESVSEYGVQSLLIHMSFWGKNEENFWRRIPSRRDDGCGQSRGEAATFVPHPDVVIAGGTWSRTKVNESPRLQSGSPVDKSDADRDPVPYVAADDPAEAARRLSESGPPAELAPNPTQSAKSMSPASTITRRRNGPTLGTIVYNGRTYYARVYPARESLPCGG